MFTDQNVFFVDCLGHEFAYGVRPFCSDSNGDLLCLGTTSPYFCSRVRILMCSWLSFYGFLQGAWPFGVVELIWSGIAVNKWWSGRRSRSLH